MRRITFIPKGVLFINNKPSVYINYPDGGTTFDGVSCKKVGSLSFRSQLTFDAQNEDLEIFLVFENGIDTPKFVKYQMPDGQGDVVMTIGGKTTSDISFGNYEKRSNAFSRMDGGKRVLLIVAAVAVFLILLHGLLHTNKFLRSISKIPETFETADLSITLSKAFVNENADGFYAFYITRTCSAGLIRESFDVFPKLKDVDFDEYCRMMIKANPSLSPKIIKEDGLTYFVFEQQWEELFKYRIYIYQTDDAYWLVQFATPADKYDYWSDCFNKWAKSVKFK